MRQTLIRCTKVLEIVGNILGGHLAEWAKGNWTAPCFGDFAVFRAKIAKRKKAAEVLQ